MDNFDLFNDVLITDRQIVKEEEREDDLQGLTQLNIIFNPAFPQAEIPNISGNQYVSPKPNHRKYRKAVEIFKLKELLALAEIRYLENVQKLKSAIISNKKINLCYVISLVGKLKLVIPIFIRYMQKIYISRWKSAMKGNEIKFSFRVKLFSFCKLWNRHVIFLKQKALEGFRQKTLLQGMMIQIYGDSMLRHKLSRFIPPRVPKESNRDKLKKLKI